MSERSERTIDSAGLPLVPEPSASEAQAMSERSERTIDSAGLPLVPEPSASEAQA